MAIISHLVNEYTTSLKQDVAAFRGRYPYDGSAQLLFEATGIELDHSREWPDLPVMTDEGGLEKTGMPELYVALSAESPLIGSGNVGLAIPYHLLMTIDGPLSKRVLVWGTRETLKIDCTQCDPQTAEEVLALGDCYAYHWANAIGEDPALDEFDGPSGDPAVTDLDSWLLKYPMQIYWSLPKFFKPITVEWDDPMKKANWKANPELPAGLNSWTAVPVAPRLKHFAEGDAKMAYVGLRPGGFQRDLNDMTTKGQATRASRETLRFICLHAATNLGDISDAYPTMETISPAPYIEEWLAGLQAESIIPETFAEFHADILMLSGTSFLSDDDLLKVRIIWPSGFDQGGGEDGTTGRNDLDLDVYYNQVPEPPPEGPETGQFYPMYTSFFVAPLDAVYFYLMIIQFWLVGVGKSETGQSWTWDTTKTVNKIWYKLNRIPDDPIHKNRRHCRPTLTIDTADEGTAGQRVEYNCGEAEVTFQVQPPAGSTCPPGFLHFSRMVDGQEHSRCPFSFPHGGGFFAETDCANGEMTEDNVQGKALSWKHMPNLDILP